jgi:hypothetical protein
MSSNKKDKLKDEVAAHIKDHIDWLRTNQDYFKDFSVLQEFTDEELAHELCRRTKLGAELE